MIEVIFKCNKCGYINGNIVTWDRTTEVECQKCGMWETMNDTTTEKTFAEITNSIKSLVPYEKDC